MTFPIRTARPPWWQRAVVYQIYPWSFQDSDGDGIGDLAGITARLDYLNDGTPDSLGIDAIWLSPIYTSPMHDFGYDVADYRGIDPRFGTVADFDRLVAEAHRRGIRIIMDLVLNHTSDRHPWFVESRSSRTAPTRHWFYWADGRGWFRRPSNWNARFGGSAWTWDATAGQYYLHSFLKEQPDLNWGHPSVRRAMREVVAFWVDRGVDGFRLDAINWLGKDTRWPDNPRRLGLRGYTRQRHLYDRDQPSGHACLRELRSWLAASPEVVLAGEASADTPGGPATFYGNGQDELHMVFDFRLLKSPWQADRFARFILEADRAVPPGGWPTLVFSNHDQSRHIDRYGTGRNAERRARAAALLLFTLRGTPFLYYGEELGMRDAPLRYRDLRDPYTKRYWPFKRGRDPARTPMQWDVSPHAGFTQGRPWLPVPATSKEVNVATQAADPHSLLHWYRRLIRLRKETPALLWGSYEPVASSSRQCLVYRRRWTAPGEAPQDLLVALNFTDEEQPVELPVSVPSGALLLSTDPARATEGTPWDPRRWTLAPDEGIVVRLTADAAPP